MLIHASALEYKDDNVLLYWHCDNTTITALNLLY